MPDDNLICPITLEPLVAPVVAVSSGITYEYRAIIRALEHNQSCPVTRKPLDERGLIPNRLVDKLLPESEETMARRKERDQYFRWMTTIPKDQPIQTIRYALRIKVKTAAFLSQVRKKQNSAGMLESRVCCLPNIVGHSWIQGLLTHIKTSAALSDASQNLTEMARVQKSHVVAALTHDMQRLTRAIQACLKFVLCFRSRVDRLIQTLQRMLIENDLRSQERAQKDHQYLQQAIRWINVGLQRLENSRRCILENHRTLLRSAARCAVSLPWVQRYARQWLRIHERREQDPGAPPTKRIKFTTGNIRPQK